RRWRRRRAGGARGERETASGGVGVAYRLISIVLPVHNQADHVAGLVAEYEAALAQLPCPHELLLVVNGCRDDSPRVCDRLAGQYACVRTLYSPRGGWGL